MYKVKQELWIRALRGKRVKIRRKRLDQKMKWVFRQIFKKILTKFNNYPYLSGDNFKDICDFAISSEEIGLDETTRKILSCNSVFIEGHLLRKLIKSHAHALQDKVIVSGNSDQNFEFIPTFPYRPKLVLCQNLTSSENTPYKTLPIGIENLRLGRSGFKYLHKPRFEFSVTDRVLLPPMSPTNESRIRTRGLAGKRNDIFDVKDGFLPTSDYFKLVREYKFVFVCEGNGFDTHRLWEILYQNSFPVIFKTKWAESLLWLNLPILMVSKIEDINPALLETHLHKFSSRQPRDYPALWMPFWEELIKT